MIKNPFSLENKNILVTGASSGIGKSCAEICSQMGANMIIIGRNEERLKETYDHLEKGNHQYFLTDIEQFESLEPLIAEAVKKSGKISGFIHAAGIESTMPLTFTKASHYNKLFSINSIAAFELSRIISKKQYISGEGASFVFISSVMGSLAQSGKTAYCASKSALINGAKAMALELAQKNIRINCVSPAMVKTKMTDHLLSNLDEQAIRKINEMHPLGFGSPADVAYACIYLLSDVARWITGTNLIIDGGYSAA